ncbi:hypothetical protein N0V82_006859 [Gnomoniopsis sp. IMI 355080]|nr:hypothetical protein N0V82_006859 [Gnomoniopsis sp. IMI 355080]
MTGSTGSVRYKGHSPIRKGNNSPRKISHSVTSVLASAQDYTRSAADSTNESGPLKSSLSRTKNVFYKFADVLTEHFTAKRSRKGDRSTEPTETTTTSHETTTHQIVHDPSLNRLSLNSGSLPIQNAEDSMLYSLARVDESVKEEVKPPIARVKAGASTARKRLTIVDEVDFQNGQALEDPFSESSSGPHNTEFEARLKSRQGARRGPTPTDPFQAENILETTVDDMLTTPPVGCSTPRLQLKSLPQCETPTQGSRGSDHVADPISFSPGRLPAAPEQCRRFPTQGGVSRRENQPVKDRKRGFAGRRIPQLKTSATSDSTRLSSSGSTIRHVPRSMGRLVEPSTLPESTVERSRTLPQGRKKHPSPSKGQLELFGKYMEENLALGVFKDADELGISFNSPYLGAHTLSPRDTNRLIRNAAGSSVELRTGYTTDGKHTALPRSRSRIPQPVRQLSRSRTDTALARDFIPTNKGDSSLGDELQWDASAYKIGPRCNHCGSKNKIG